jgi:hypothetical protein
MRGYKGAAYLAACAHAASARTCSATVQARTDGKHAEDRRTKLARTGALPGVTRALQVAHRMRVRLRVSCARVCVRVCVRVRVRVVLSVCVCVRARVRARVRVCACDVLCLRVLV